MTRSELGTELLGALHLIIAALRFELIPDLLEVVLVLASRCPSSYPRSDRWS